MTCVCGVGELLEAREQRVDEVVADLVQVVLAVVEVPAVRRRLVEHRLQGDVRHRPDEIERGGQAAAQRREHPLALGDLPAPRDRDGGDAAGPRAARGTAPPGAR